MGEKKVVNHVISPQGKQIAVPKVELVFGAVLSSMEIEETKNIIGTEPSQDQVVVAAAEGSWLNAGDKIRINFDSFPKSRRPGKHDTKDEFDIIMPVEEIDKRKYFYLNDRQVKFKYKS